MTTDELLLSAGEVGLRVSNLFQRDDGQWQANLREVAPNEKNEHAHEFGLGPTPNAALTAAYEAAGCKVE